MVKMFRHLAVGVALLFCSWLCPPVMAQSFYQPGSRIEISTESLLAEIPGEKVSKIVIESETDGSRNLLHFYLKDYQTLIGSLIFNSGGKIEWTGPGKNDPSFQAEDLFIIDGISVPMNILPIHKILNTEDAVVYDFSREAGGRTFLSQVEIRATSVEMDTAVANGWIRASRMTSGPLKMIAAKNARTGELILQQLWADSDVWWLYEETPLRRSWRTP